MNFEHENNIIYSGDIQFEHDFGGLGNVFYQYMKKHSHRIAQIESESEKSETFEYLLTKCIRTAIEMRSRGIKKGDLVSLCASNHLDACVPIIASFFLGAVPYALEVSLQPTVCAKLIEQASPKIIFVDPPCLKLVQESFKLANKEVEVIVFGDDFETYFLSPKGSEENFRPIFVENQRLTAIIYFSSGSTGLPKPICLSHYSIMANCGKLTNENYTIFSPRYGCSVFCGVSGWYWITSGFSLLSSTVLGNTRILVLKYNAEEMWNLIGKYKINGLYLNTVKLVELCEIKKLDTVDISCLDTIVTSGASLPKHHFLKIRSTLPGVFICKRYGASEFGILTGYGNVHENDRLRKMWQEKPDSVGFPKTGFWLKIVDVQTGEALGPNQTGELYLKSKYNLLNGYYNRNSSDIYDEDGWFHTGDIMYYDEDFYLHFVQRSRELLKYKGNHIFPAILEEILVKHPAVANAVVIGNPHETEGDHPIAVVILKENVHGHKEDLMKYVNERVGEMQKLRGGMEFVKSFPLTCTGKIDKPALKRMILDTNIS